MQKRASCSQHDRHERRCGACATAEISLYFPESMLGPWKARVAADLGEPWEARMLPFSGEPSEKPIWVLGGGRVGSVSVRLASYVQADLISLAKGLR